MSGFKTETATVVKLLCSPVAREPEVGEQNGDQIRTQREKLTQESLESRLYRTLRWPSFPRGGGLDWEAFGKTPKTPNVL